MFSFSRCQQAPPAAAAPSLAGQSNLGATGSQVFQQAMNNPTVITATVVSPPPVRPVALPKAACKAVLNKSQGFKIADCCDDIPDQYVMGLAWDVTNGVNIDLDASVICLDARYQPLEIVYYGCLQSKNRSIRHSGDEREGDEVGDDESIQVDLEHVDPRVQYLGFVINSYSGQSLNCVSNARCRFYNAQTRHEIASFNMSSDRRLNCTAMLMILLYRVGTDWWMHAVGEGADGKTAFDNVDEFQAFLARTDLVTTQMQAAPKPMQKAKIKVPSNLGSQRKLGFRTPGGGTEEVIIPRNVQQGETVEVPIVDIYTA